MQLIQDLITTESLCVLATVGQHGPHTSIMTFFADHAVMKFYFLSRKTSRKNKHIKKNPHVSLLIDRRDDFMSLSIDAVYTPIKSKQTQKAIRKLFLLKAPHLKEFASHPDTELIRVEGRFATLAQGYTDVFTTKLKNT